jgi:hypothetical protein
MTPLSIVRIQPWLCPVELPNMVELPAERRTRPRPFEGREALNSVVNAGGVRGVDGSEAKGFGMLERHAARLRFRTCEGELESDHLMREAIRGHQRQSRELESDHLMREAIRGHQRQSRELESDHLMREAIRGHQRQSRELESDHLRLLLHRRAEGACVGGLLRRVVERVAESGNLKVE